jgi:hypothetical protein
MRIWAITRNDYPITWFFTKSGAEKFMAKYQKAESVFGTYVSIRTIKRLSTKDAMAQLLSSDTYVKKLIQKNSGKRQELSAGGAGV